MGQDAGAAGEGSGEDGATARGRGRAGATGRSGSVRAPAVWAAMIYCAAGVAWIWGSAWVLGLLALPEGIEERVEGLKGTAFVVVTAVVLYLLVGRALRKMARAREQALRARTEAHARAVELERVLADLRRSQLILEQAQELGGIGSWVSDPAHHGGHLTWSRETYRIFGIEEGTFDGRVETYFTFVHPEDREAVRTASLDALAGKREYAIDHRIVRPDGAVRWVHERARIERDESGAPLRMIGVCQDITDRREADAALRQSEEQLRLLFRSLPVPAWVFDARTLRFLAVNEAATAKYGWTEEQFLSMTVLDIRPEEDRARLLEVIEHRGRGYHEVTGFRHRLADGRLIDVEVSSHDLVFEGVPARVTLARDVTETQRTAAALAESEERYRLVLKATSDALWEYDVLTDKLKWGDNIEGLFGVRPTDVGEETEPWASRLHPEDRDRASQSFGDAIERGDERWSEQYRFRRGDGTYAVVLDRAYMLKGQDGRVVRAIGAMSDVTERERAEEALRESEERYRQMFHTNQAIKLVLDPETGMIVDANEAASEFYGYPLERLTSMHIGAINTADKATIRAGLTRAAAGRVRFEFTHRLASGALRDVDVYTGPVVLHGKRLLFSIVHDVTERRLNERLLAGQARTLERLVGGEPLAAVLEEIVGVVEEQEQGCVASVLLLDEDGRTARTVAAPNLPEAYSRAIDGVQIGPGVGSCGTAMYEGRRVVVPDIATDPLWAGYKELALAHGLRACWSEPIVGAGERVLGSLAMYYPEVRAPVERELRTIAWAARLAGLAVERRQSEQRLRKREADLSDLLTAVPDLMFRMSAEGRYLDFHAPSRVDLYIAPEEFLGKTVREIMPPDLAEQCMEHLLRAVTTGAPQIYEYTVNGARGIRHWEVRITRCGEGEALLLVRDITVRRTAERRLRESEQRLSLLVQQSPLAVIVWNLDFTVAEWNRAAEHIFGWTAQEALGRNARFIFPPNTTDLAEKTWRALLEGRDGSRSTNANIARDGRTIYCEWYNSPLVDADGRAFAVASIVDDVTEQRSAQQRQQLMMAELDHRVKNNLAAVISLAEQSGRATTNYPEFRASFLGRVRALSRLHNALAATRWQGADLGALVRQTLEAFGQDATSQAVVEGPDVVLPARAAQAMGMALNELCTNAIKYGALSRPGGRVEVRWAVRPGAAAPADGGDAADNGRPATGPTLELAWLERGGPEVVEPSRRGFGTELIDGAISYELGGSAVLLFPPEGLECHIRIELGDEAEFDPRDIRPGSLDDATS